MPFGKVTGRQPSNSDFKTGGKPPLPSFFERRIASPGNLPLAMTGRTGNLTQQHSPTTRPATTYHLTRHCEERRDEAIQGEGPPAGLLRAMPSQCLFEQGKPPLPSFFFERRIASPGNLPLAMTGRTGNLTQQRTPTIRPATTYRLTRHCEERSDEAI
ncbi:MAG: hypothetical protein LBT00_12645 [Spirochaetaceae bacterium]|nr:hypothetical protein [Spirochaetaceae bacterium]